MSVAVRRGIVRREDHSEKKRRRDHDTARSMA
jgi:hypothetical protein